MKVIEERADVKTVEVKRINPKSTVKVMLYMMVPVVVVMLMLAILATIGSAAFAGQNSGIGAFFGVKVMAGFLGLLAFQVVLVVVLTFIMALIYNLFAEKFGGFVMDLQETEIRFVSNSVETSEIEQDGSKYV